MATKTWSAAVEAQARESYQADLEARRIEQFKEWLREEARLERVVEEARRRLFAFRDEFARVKDRPLTEPLGVPYYEGETLSKAPTGRPFMAP